jgi:hypothetical protein
VIGLAMSLGVLSCTLGLLCFICWRKKVAGNTKDLGDNVSMDDELEKGIGARRSQTTFAEGGAWRGSYKSKFNKAN